MRTNRVRNQLAVLVAAFMLNGCTSRERESSSFQSAIDSGPTPWTGVPTARPRGFQFAVVGDRTGFMVPGVFARAVDKINLLQPDFVMSIGDLVETWTEDRVEMVEAWDELDALAARLDAPMFYTVGNHDIGNPTSLDLWR